MTIQKVKKKRLEDGTIDSNKIDLSAIGATGLVELDWGFDTTSLISYVCVKNIIGA